MPTLKYFVNGKKRELASIYVRLASAGGVDLIAKTGLFVNPQTWSNKTQTLKQRIRTDADEKFIKDLNNLQDHIEQEFKNFQGEHSKEWLTDAIYKFHHKKSMDAKTLNDFISRFIKDADSGERKNKSGVNLASGTVKAWKGFQRIFNEYQGVYTPDRIEWHKENKKALRPKRKIDFEGITIDFYNSFVKFLSDEGYNKGTRGRFIKELKFFMKKSLDDKLHDNREFEHSAFKGFTSESFSIYLTKSEIDKLYNLDLSEKPELDIARDSFLVLCETSLRISDYQKVDLSIRQDENGTKLIYITQTKTGGQVVIPLSARLETILKKYNGNLPKTYDQYINRNIKIVAKEAGLTDVLKWESEKFGKKFEKKAFKWELVTCHTGRRSACTNMFLAGIPTISIMQISGHKSEKMFMKYIKVTPEENARKLAVHPYFNGLKAV